MAHEWLHVIDVSWWTLSSIREYRDPRAYARFGKIFCQKHQRWQHIRKLAFTLAQPLKYTYGTSKDVGAQCMALYILYMTQYIHQVDFLTGPQDTNGLYHPSVQLALDLPLFFLSSLSSSQPLAVQCTTVSIHHRAVRTLNKPPLPSYCF